MRRWRMGIIGSGWAGEQHARAMRALADRVELVAVADVDVGRAAALVERWQALDWTGDYRELWNHHILDAVSICLPHHLHAPVAIAAAQEGMHILVEKPLATTLAEADAMIATADAAGVRLMVAENMRFDRTYQEVAALIQSGALGEVFLVRLSREHEMHAYLRARPWFLQEESGGILYSGGIHDFELLRMLAGEIEHVYALQAPKALPEMRGDDTAVVLAGMRSGAVAVVTESFSLKTPEPGVQGSVHGSRGSLWFGGNRIRRYPPAGDAAPAVAEEITVAPHDTFEAELAHFLDCLDDDREPITSARDQRKPLVAVLAAYASIKRGERVYLAEVEAAHSPSPL